MYLALILIRIYLFCHLFGLLEIYHSVLFMVVVVAVVVYFIIIFYEFIGMGPT